MPFEGYNTPPLFGYLAHAADDSHHPAIIILHGFSGLTPHFVTESAVFRSWGYVALALGSLGNINACAGPQLSNPASSAEAKGAYNALRYISSLQFVDPEKIIIMGYSMVGWALIKAIERGPLEQSEPSRFRAAVAFYPWCGSSTGVMTIPTLILIGDRDDWAPASQCQMMAAHQSVSGVDRPHEGKPVKLIIYPGATHGFDRQRPAANLLRTHHHVQPDCRR
jgi:dienelactone hydrolase